MIRGKFITFEGGDGVGKSTQIARLAASVHAHGIDCVVTREPGGTPFAERVRELILKGDLPQHSPMAEALLFGAARYDHVGGLIRPALDAGRWVLCDRFADSTRAYQGVAGGVGSEALTQLEQLVHADCMPDLTLILDLDPGAGRKRIEERGSASATSRGDPFEGRSHDFQARLRNAFLEIAQREPARCEVINASGDADVVEAAIRHVVAARVLSDLEPS
jgi:dTMP kinase